MKFSFVSFSIAAACTILSTLPLARADDHNDEAEPPPNTTETVCTVLLTSILWEDTDFLKVHVPSLEALEDMGLDLVMAYREAYNPEHKYLPGFDGRLPTIDGMSYFSLSKLDGDGNGDGSDSDSDGKRGLGARRSLAWGKKKQKKRKKTKDYDDYIFKPLGAFVDVDADADAGADEAADKATAAAADLGNHRSLDAVRTAHNTASIAAPVPTSASESAASLSASPAHKEWERILCKYARTNPAFVTMEDCCIAIDCKTVPVAVLGKSDKSKDQIRTRNRNRNLNRKTAAMADAGSNSDSNSNRNSNTGSSYVIHGRRQQTWGLGPSKNIYSIEAI
eukprot:jgi/Psemu1/513/gm1.513_g